MEARRKLKSCKHTTYRKKTYGLGVRSCAVKMMNVAPERKYKP